MNKLLRKLSRILGKKQTAIESENYEEAARLRDIELAIEAQIEAEKKNKQ